jgi:hypothetical protein
MQKFNSKSKPTEEEWAEIIDERKRFEPGDIVEYGLFYIPFEVVCLKYENSRGFVYEIKNDRFGIRWASSGFLNPYGTFMDNGEVS